MFYDNMSLMSRMSSDLDKVLNTSNDMLKFLCKYAINKDADVMSCMSPVSIVYCWNTLQELGITDNIDINKLLLKLEPIDIIRNYDVLKRNGASINMDEVVSKLDPNYVAFNIDELEEKGASIDINTLLDRIDFVYLSGEEIGYLLAHGADVEKILDKINPWQIVHALDAILSHGGIIDINMFYDHKSVLRTEDIVRSLGTLYKYGYRIKTDRLKEIMPFVNCETILENFDDIVDHGFCVDELVAILEDYAVDHLDVIMKYYDSLDQVILKMKPITVEHSIEKLLSRGANIEQIMAAMLPHNIVRSIDILLKNGANIDDIVSAFSKYSKIKYREVLEEHGARLN